MIHSSQFLFLDVYVPIPQGLSPSLDASVRVQVFLDQSVDKLVTPEVKEAILDLDVVQMEHADTRLHRDLSEVGERHALSDLSRRDLQFRLLDRIAVACELGRGLGHSQCKGLCAYLSTTPSRRISRH